MFIRLLGHVRPTNQTKKYIKREARKQYENKWTSEDEEKCEMWRQFVISSHDRNNTKPTTNTTTPSTKPIFFSLSRQNTYGRKLNMDFIIDRHTFTVHIWTSSPIQHFFLSRFLGWNCSVLHSSRSDEGESYEYEQYAWGRELGDTAKRWHQPKRRKIKTKGK